MIAAQSIRRGSPTPTSSPTATAGTACSSTRTASTSRCRGGRARAASRSPTCSSPTPTATTSSTSASSTRRFGVPVLAHPLNARGRRASTRRSRTATSSARATSRSARRDARPLPDHLALLVDGTDCLTADCLFKGTVGGTSGGGPTGYADQVHSIMDRLMTLPPATRVHPGHRGDDDRRRVGAEPVHPRSGAASTRRATSPAACAASRPR